MGQNYQPPQQPGQSPPYQPPPYQPQYVPPQFVPPPPARKRRPIWQWGCGAVLVLFICGGIAAVVAPPKSPTSPAQVAIAQATATVAPATLAPTTVMPTSPPALAATTAPTPPPPPTLAPPEPTQTEWVVAPQTNLVVTHSPGIVSDGSTASVSAKTTPGASCSLSVIYASGTESTAAGIVPKAADASGNVSWSWKIGAKTGSGDATARITCGDASVDAPFTVK